MKKELHSKLNKYLADLSVLSIKFHNLHWNVTGEDFKENHEYLDELRDGIEGQIDSVAEIMKTEGLFPAGSMKEYLALTSVEELGSGTKSVRESFEIVLKEFKALKAEALDIRKTAGEDDEFVVANTMEDYVEGFNKIIWFIEAMLK